jgi:hypothetical protein
VKKQLWQNLIRQYKSKLNPACYDRLSKIRFRASGEVIRNTNYKYAVKHFPVFVHMINDMLMRPFMNHELYSPPKMENGG